MFALISDESLESKSFYSMRSYICKTVSLWCCYSLDVASSIPTGCTIIYRYLCVFICVSLCQSNKIKSTNMYITRARAQFKIYTHTQVLKLHSRRVVRRPAPPRSSLGLWFLAHFLWNETNLLDNWQLALLPCSGGIKFDPRLVRDNLSAPSWIICVSLC